MQRLLLVSNRLPITAGIEDDRLVLAKSAGGLATGLSGPHERGGGAWIGWPGDVSSLSSVHQQELDRRLEELRLVPVHLSREEVARFYEGFSNGVLWPLLHDLIDRIPADSMDWTGYRQVNERFAGAVVEAAREDDVVWIHDYQLSLVPALVRARRPRARIGFFLHVPFPAAEVFRVLPWRAQVLEGILGADLVGFHTEGYAAHFKDACKRILGARVRDDEVVHKGRLTRVGAFPMGIDFQAFDQLARTAEVERHVRCLREESGGARLLVGIDRLDYTKGIPRRLLAVERLLEELPKDGPRVRLIQVVVPSRENVEAYDRFKREVEGLVGRINGAHGSLGAMPVHYLYRSLDDVELAGLYRAADVMLVTPLRDGMNLVAKEFAASRIDEDGVLVLSELAGAAEELKESVRVNPYDVDGCAAAIRAALSFDPDERRRRMRGLRRRVRGQDVQSWVKGFLEALTMTDPKQTRPAAELKSDLRALVDEMAAAERLTLLLDYDGTLVPIVDRPEHAAPDEDVRELIRALARREGTTVHIVSGRKKEDLEPWLGDLGVNLVAEHGLFGKRPGGAWSPLTPVRNEWKSAVRVRLEALVRDAPGSFVEEKTASLAWHFRLARPPIGLDRQRALAARLATELSEHPVDVLTGDKVVEVRLSGANKSIAVQWAASVDARPSLLVAFGDDRTDEDLFAALPEGSIAIHVGNKETNAGYRVPDPAAARAMLRALVDRAPGS